MGPYPSVRECLCDLYALDTPESRPLIFLSMVRYAVVQCSVLSYPRNKGDFPAQKKLEKVAAT